MKIGIVKVRATILTHLLATSTHLMNEAKNLISTTLRLFVLNFLQNNKFVMLNLVIFGNFVEFLQRNRVEMKLASGQQHVS